MGLNKSHLFYQLIGQFRPKWSHSGPGPNRTFFIWIVQFTNSFTLCSKNKCFIEHNVKEKSYVLVGRYKIGCRRVGFLCQKFLSGYRPAVCSQYSGYQPFPAYHLTIHQRLSELQPREVYPSVCLLSGLIHWFGAPCSPSATHLARRSPHQMDFFIQDYSTVDR